MRKLWLVLIASIFGVAAYTVAFGITAISTSDLSNDAPISDSIDTKFLFPKLVVAMVPVKPIIKTKSLIEDVASRGREEGGADAAILQLQFHFYLYLDSTENSKLKYSLTNTIPAHL